MTEISCETQGHLWGPLNVCIMCKTPKPVERGDRLTEIKARVARYKEGLSGMRRSNDSFWVSDLEYALAELERLQWDVEAKDVEWKLQEEMKDKAVAERDALRAEVERLTVGIEKLCDNSGCHGDVPASDLYELISSAALEESK